MRVLCAGDLHIGRRSSRLPVDTAESTSAASAWGRIVEYAVSQKLDVVALSGDVVDEKNRYFEAIGPLERGLKRLADAGIRTVAVAGNHDFNVLPQLAHSLPEGYLQLLGAGGKWERASIRANDGTTLHVDGWSFSTSHVYESPVASYNLPPTTDGPILGLLHGDLDQPTSKYAPTSLIDLQAVPVAMWLLGHVHVPSLKSGGGKPPVLYPGSPQPLDPGESGNHGAWLVEFAPGKPVVPQRVPLASARYEWLDIDVSDLTNPDQARVLMLARIRESAEEFARDNTQLRHLSLRVCLTGRSQLRQDLVEELSAASELDLELDGVSVHVERVDVETRPDRDLTALEIEADATGYLARLLLALEQGRESPEHHDLLNAARAVPMTLDGAKPYRSLKWEATELGDEALHAQVADVAGELLDELLRQNPRAT